MTGLARKVGDFVHEKGRKNTLSPRDDDRGEKERMNSVEVGGGRWKVEVERGRKVKDQSQGRG